MGFRRRQVAVAALTANAIRPVPGFRAGIPAFFAGWLTGELAPHLLAATATDLVHHAARGRGRRDPVGLAAAGLGLGGLAYLVAQSRRTGTVAAQALEEALGADYVDAL